MGKRLFAAAAFIPPAVVFLIWALLTRASMRGPAGGLGFTILILPVPFCLYFAYRVTRGEYGPWSWPVRIAAGFNALVLVWILVARRYVVFPVNAMQEADTRVAMSAVRRLIMLEVKAGRPPPKRLSDLVPRKLEMIPLLSLPGTGHAQTREVRLGRSTDLRDSGKWLYVNEPKDPLFGMLRVDCTHQDSRGVAWSAY